MLVPITAVRSWFGNAIRFVHCLTIDDVLNRIVLFPRSSDHLLLDARLFHTFYVTKLSEHMEFLDLDSATSYILEILDALTLK